MFCPKCGAQIADDVTFCAYCGNAVQPAANNQPSNGYQPPVYNQYPNSYQQPMNYQQPPYQQPMKWFKFLIYFGLWAGAVVNALSGFGLLTGGAYSGAADYVYMVFSGLQAVDVLFGLVMLALAAFGIFTRFRLAGFHKNGPKMLTYTYVFGMAASLLYLVAVFVVVPGIGDYMNFTSYITSSITSVIMIFVNKDYFGKRAALFTKD